MNDGAKKQKNIKKQTIIIISVVAISVALIVIASAIIYNYFFKENIKTEETRNQITQQFDKTLEQDRLAAEESVKQAKEIIKKHNLDIYGQYYTVYNELTENNSNDAPQNTTESVTLGMMVNEDMTLNFSDGKKGWWNLAENEEGIVHMGIGREGAEDMEMLMLCDNCMISLGYAVFFGDISEDSAMEGNFTDARGNMTLTFKKDGTVGGEYNEIIEEDGEKFPWTEVYRGQYKRSGEYLDLVLNNSSARYIIFSTQTNDPGKPVSGFASRYYLKVKE